MSLIGMYMIVFPNLSKLKPNSTNHKKLLLASCPKLNILANMG